MCGSHCTAASGAALSAAVSVSSTRCRISSAHQVQSASVLGWWWQVQVPSLLANHSRLAAARPFTCGVLQQLAQPRKHLGRRRCQLLRLGFFAQLQGDGGWGRRGMSGMIRRGRSGVLMRGLGLNVPPLLFSYILSFDCSLPQQASVPMQFATAITPTCARARHAPICTAGGLPGASPATAACMYAARCCAGMAGASLWREVGGRWVAGCVGCGRVLASRRRARSMLHTGINCRHLQQAGRQGAGPYLEATHSARPMRKGGAEGTRSSCKGNVGEPLQNAHHL